MLETFGDPRAPLRISALTALTKCPGFLVLTDCRMSSDFLDKKSAAAHNGTAAGRAIELFHAGLGVGESLAMTEEESTSGCRGRSFELVQMGKVEAWVRRYCADPRNEPEVVVESSMEAEVELLLDPAPEDPTGEPILLVGHVDQIRREPDGTLRLWDVKSGAADGLPMLFSHAWQLAAYTLACRATLGEPVLPGGIIRLRGYDSKSKKAEALDPDWLESRPVFFDAPWSIDACEAMMANVAQAVAWIRLGIVSTTPGPHCGWCPATGPHLCDTRLLEGVLDGS